MTPGPSCPRRSARNFASTMLLPFRTTKVPSSWGRHAVLVDGPVPAGDHDLRLRRREGAHPGALPSGQDDCLHAHRSFENVPRPHPEPPGYIRSGTVIMGGNAGGGAGPRPRSTADMPCGYVVGPLKGLLYHSRCRYEKIHTSSPLPLGMARRYLVED